MKRLLKLALILMASASTLAWGADTAIWSLTDGTTANATDRIPIARSAVANNYITPLEISTYIGTTYGTGCATFLVTPTSANLRGCITDESGTGAALFAGGAMGTPSSITLTNGTGLPISTGVSGLGTGVATAAANATNASGGLATQNGTITSGNILKGSATGVQDTGIAASALQAIIYSGQKALGTGAIASGACATVVTQAATGLATTSTVSLTYAATPVGVTGYDPSVTTGSLQVTGYPTANQVNISVCNPTSSSITPAAMSVNVVAY